MKKLFLLLAFFLLAAQADAATTYWASPSGGAASCAAASGASDPGQYRTVAQAFLCMASGDTLKFKVGLGDYTVAISVEGAGLPPSGTSASFLTRVESETAGTRVVFKPAGVQAVFDDSDSHRHFVQYKDLSFDGAGGTPPVYRIGWRVAGDDNIFDNIEVKNAPSNGMIVSDEAQRNLIKNAWSHHNGLTGPDVPNLYGHGLYLEGDNTIVEYSRFEDNGGYGIQVRHSFCCADNNEIRFSTMTRNGTVGEGGFVDALSTGTKFHHNLSYANNGRGMIHNRAGKYWNNAFVNNGDVGALTQSGAQNGWNFSNNHFIGNSGGQLVNEGSSTGTSQTNNTTASAASCYVDAASGNFGLLAGCALIDAGTASIASGITAPGNGLPDIGAIESLPLPTLTVNGTVVTLTQGNNTTDQMLPSSGAVTGFTIRKNGSNDALSSVARSGTNSWAGTAADVFVGGDTCDGSYATTGNWTSNNKVGGVTSSDQELFAATNTITCVNLTGGGGGSVGLADYRIYLAQGTDPTLWTAKCAVNTPCTVAPGALVWIASNLRNNSGNPFATFNFATRVSYASGAYVTLTDVGFVDGIMLPGSAQQLGTVINNATAMPTNLIANRETTDVTGQAIRVSGSFPSLTMADATEVNLATLVKFSPTATGNFKFCPYSDTGTALTCTAPAEINIGSFSSMH